jgi:hypothetical protein
VISGGAPKSINYAAIATLARLMIRWTMDGTNEPYCQCDAVCPAAANNTPLTR